MVCNCPCVQVRHCSLFFVAAGLVTTVNVVCWHCLKPILESKCQLVKLKTNVSFWSYWKKKKKKLQLRMPQNVITICEKTLNNTNKNAIGLYSPVWCLETQTMQRFHQLCHYGPTRLSLWCIHTHTHTHSLTHTHTLYVAAELILKMQRNAQRSNIFTKFHTQTVGKVCVCIWIQLTACN